MKEENGNTGKNTEEQTSDKKKSNENALVTKESLGAVGALFSALAFLILITRSLIFGDVGVAVNSFLLGIFGYGAYAFVPAFFLVSVAAFIGKRLIRNRSAALCIFLSLFTALLIVHGAVTASWERSGYFSACFTVAEGGVKTCSPAGWLGGLVVGALFSVAGTAGAFVLLSLALLFFAALSVKAVTGKSLFGALFKRLRAENTARKQNEKTQKSQGGARPQSSEGDGRYAASGENGARVSNVAYPDNNAAEYNDSYGGGAYGSGESLGYEKRNEYGFPAENVRMRPAVSLSKDAPQSADMRAARAPSSFSPFGSTSYNDNGQVNAPARQNAAPYDGADVPGGRDLLYSDDAIERFRNNLIFDPNSKFNRRNSAANQPINQAAERRVSPVPPVSRSASESSSSVRGVGSAASFGTSYTDYYADSVNGANGQNRVVSAGNGAEANACGANTPNAGYSREVSDFARESAAENAAVSPADDDGIFRKAATPRGYEDASGVFSNDDFNRGEAASDGADFTDSLRGGNDRGNDAGIDRENDVSEEYGGVSRGDTGRDFSRESAFRSEEFGARRENDDLTIFDDEDEFLRGAEEDFSRGRGTEEGVTRGENGADENRNVGFASRDFSSRDYPSRDTARAPQSVQPPRPQQPRPRRPYRAAPLDFFDCTDTRPDQNATEIEENKRTILDTLEAFKVPDASIASVTCGPTVTRYNVAVPRNISPKKVVALDQPIAMNLHAKNGVNIAPNFEDGTISVEVPNRKRQTVTLGCMIASEEFINSKPNALVFAMGKNVGNKKEYGDIRKMTHILVAGTSGSGKTAFLHSIIISLIMKYSPADLRLILIDPKKTEFVVYEGLPHLVINEVLSDTNKVIQSLNWAIAEMERRYDLFSKKSRAGTYVIDIDEYNANLSEGEEKLPKIVIIADEVAAMMQDAKKDMEDRIQNLTQKSRATGIHVILATQRPSTDVITGVIKSNLKTRIALSVAQEIDSRVILDESGAQNLLGQGDLLYSTEGTKTPVRLQAPFISSEKAQEVIRYIKENNDCYFNEEAAAYIDKPKSSYGASGADGEEDDQVDYVYVEALRNVILSGSASISLVQRKCSVGYNKAGKIIEWMEDQGYISAFDGAKARKVLITPEQFEEKYGPL
ncbi:MAG: DNA translocase FtsK [Candidatus Borkfalkiaceae bacterium]|nr:DNA translocase FtsK [Christensenellaceae bacterium]